MKRKTTLAAIILFLGSSFINAQDEWTEVPSGTQKKLNTIDFPSSQIGYIGGEDSLLLKTTDGGINWTEVAYSGVTFLPDGDDILNIQFLNDLVGFMTVGPYSGTYKTIDGGTTWSPITDLQTINLCNNQGMYFFDQSNGFVGGSGCFQGEIIGKMTENNWTEGTITDATNESSNFIVDIHFLNENFGLAASKSGNILRTTDAGSNWSVITPPFNNGVVSPLTSIIIINENLAFAGFDTDSFSPEDDGCFMSTDGGLNWTIEDMSTFAYFSNTFHQAGNGKIFTGGKGVICGIGGTINEKYDGDTSWTTTIFASVINDISSHSESIIFAVGWNGYIVRKHSRSSGVDELKAKTLSLNVFPNPSSSLIQLQFPDKLNIKNNLMNIYSINGDIIESRTISSTLDISTYSNGMYYIEINIDNQLIREKFIKN